MGKQFTKSWSKWDYIYDIPIELQIPIKDRPFIEKGLDRLNLQQLSLLYNSIRDNRLDKYLDEEDWVDMKEKISSTIFDFDLDQGTNYNRPDEEDCNAIAELIMQRLGYKLLEGDHAQKDY